MMNDMYKYPRTPHITGSAIQGGDEDLRTVMLDTIAGKHLVIEEKLDGANCGVSFSEDGELRLQSRGHFLTGGYRERHFNLLKTWAGVYSGQLFQMLGTRYIMYGEWLYAKHTVYYDKLPHYFFEFDILDLEKMAFLSTEQRQLLLSGLPFVVSVPILKTGTVNNIAELLSLLSNSLYKTKNWKENLHAECEKNALNYEEILVQTDNSDLAEGLYIKWEENGIVQGRYKYVRQEFTAQILSNDSHWLDRPIIANGLEAGELPWI